MLLILFQILFEIKMQGTRASLADIRHWVMPPQANDTHEIAKLCRALFSYVCF